MDLRRPFRVWSATAAQSWASWVWGVRDGVEEEDLAELFYDTGGVNWLYWDGNYFPMSEREFP